MAANTAWLWSPELVAGIWGGKGALKCQHPSSVCISVPQICRHFQCVSASVLNYDCDVEKQCHGHGVSRDERQQVLKW